MFKKIKSILTSVWRRFWRHPAMPVVVHRMEADGFGPERGHQRRENHDARADGFGRMDPAEAAREIFAPSHGEEESYGFAQVGPDGTVPHQGEQWDRENNSMRVRRRKFMLVTCSKGVVRSAEEINGICSECHGPEATAVRCSICGAILCQLHAYVLEHPTGQAVYCRTHVEEAMDNWDTWEAYDIQHGTQPNKSVYPGRPHAVARYSQK